MRVPKAFRIRKFGDRWEVARSQWAMGGGYYYQFLMSFKTWDQALHYCEGRKR